MGRAGAVAGIHRAQLKKAKEELARIEEALDRSKIGGEGTAAERVEALAAEVVLLRQKVNDMEWEGAR